MSNVIKINNWDSEIYDFPFDCENLDVFQHSTQLFDFITEKVDSLLPQLKKNKRVNEASAALRREMDRISMQYDLEDINF